MKVFNNTGWVYQYGDGNNAEQDLLLGGGNTNNINNQAYIEQYNNDNDASQEMRGDGNYSYIFQNGNENDAVSVQN